MKKAIILVIIATAALSSLTAGGEKEYVREAAAIENEYMLADIEKTIQEETAEIKATTAIQGSEEETKEPASAQTSTYNEVQMLQPGGFLPAFGMTDPETKQESRTEQDERNQEMLYDLEEKIGEIAARLELLKTESNENENISGNAAARASEAVEKIDDLRKEFSSAAADMDKRIYLLEALFDRLDQDAGQMESRINALERQESRQEIQMTEEEALDDDEMGRRVMIAVSAFMSGIALMFVIKNITDKRF